MGQKHKKNSSFGNSKTEKSKVASRVLKQSMKEIQNVQTLIGKQSIKWSFSKASRFSSKKPEFSGNYVNIKSSIGKGRSAGFGYGKRWTPFNPKGKDAPPSTTYTVPGILDQKIIGGKILPPKSTKKNNNRRLSSPGPGAYEIRSKIGTGVAWTLKSRHTSLARHCSPPPGTYFPNHSLVESGRYLSISFGRKNTNDNISRFATPGPGSYDFASTFSSLTPSPSPKRQQMNRRESL